ncbi:MAG TPA: hypothetical protein VFB15_08590 [Candidatus Binataceae bacterium]|nr:hypothetical protein [Candidatus Binataceae bacterium]
MTLIAGLVAAVLGAGCNGLGGGNSTNPGSTPNSSAQLVFRFVGSTGVPFIATVSDPRSSWRLHGVVPLNVLIVNGPLPNPIRIIGTKVTNDTRLLSVEIIQGFNVKTIATTSTPYGTIVAGINGALPALGAPANPDVRFYVKGPPNGVYNALVEDESVAYVLQAASPTVILFDSPNGNSETGRVDGQFTQVKGAPIDIDLFFNNQFVHASGSGTFTIKIN